MAFIDVIIRYPPIDYSELAISAVLIVLAVNSTYFIWQTRKAQLKSRNVASSILDDLETDEPIQPRFPLAMTTGIIQILMGLALMAFAFWVLSIVLSSTILTEVDVLIRFLIIGAVAFIGSYQIYFSFKTLRSLHLN